MWEKEETGKETDNVAQQLLMKQQHPEQRKKCLGK